MQEVASIKARIDEMVGLPQLKKQVTDLIAAARVDEQRVAMGKAPEPEVMNLLFSGPPGTGKTTTAGLIAPLYNALGIVPTRKYVDVKASDLIGEYKNEAPGLVREAFAQAKGGVLFIDEAYALVSSRDDESGKQALAEIVGLMDGKQYQDTVVILGGYPEELHELMSVNPGMSRRFSRTLDFQSFEHEDRVEIMRRTLKREGYHLSGKGAAPALRDAIWDTGNGNAGDVLKLWREVKLAQKARLAPVLHAMPAAEKRRAMDEVTEADVRAGHASFLAMGGVDSPIRLVKTGRKKAVA